MMKRILSILLAALILLSSLSGMALAEEKTITVSEPDPYAIYSGVKTTATYHVTVSGYEAALDASNFGIYDYYEIYSFSEFNSLMSSYYEISLSIERDSKTYTDGAQHFLLKINFPASGNTTEINELELCTKPTGATEYDAYGSVYLPKNYFTSILFSSDDYETVPEQISNDYYYNAYISWELNGEAVQAGTPWVSGATYTADFSVYINDYYLMFMPEEKYATDAFNIGEGKLIGTPTIENDGDSDYLHFTAQYTVPKESKAERAVYTLLGKDNQVLELVENSVSVQCSSMAQLAIFDSSDLTNNQAKLIGMDEGVILSGGNSGGIFAKNGGGAYSNWQPTNDVDTDLKNLLDKEVAPNSYNFYDTISLRFKVKALKSGTLLFRYSFGSLEMTEDPQYNDIFALFSRDVTNGDSGAFKNLAIMPKTRADDPEINITITNLRNDIIDKEYDHNATSIQFVDEYFSTFTDIQYNGITNLYNAAFTAEEGHTYELKLSITDVSDEAYDSAVFLKAGSFDIVPAQPSLSADYVNPKQPGHELAIRNEDATLTGVMVVQDANGNTVWTSGSVTPGNSVKINEADIEAIADTYGYGLYYVYFRSDGKLSPAAQFNIGLTKVNTPIDLSYFHFETQEEIDQSTEVQEAIEQLELNGGEATLILDPETGDLIMTLDEIILDSTASPALSLPGDITVDIKGDTTLISTGIALKLSDGDKPSEIKGEGTLNVQAPIGIESDGDLLIGGNVAIDATELGIGCDTLTVEGGASLTINLPEDSVEAGFLNVSKLVIPDGYEIIGGKIDDEGNFTPDEGATQLIIRKAAAPFEYKIIKGAHRVVNITDSMALFASDAPFRKFDHVEVDGKTVASKYYVASSGSTEIEFNQDYIKTLALGKHSLTIASTDGSASTDFTVITDLPATGDSTDPMMLIYLMLTVLGVMVLTYTAAKRKN